MKTFEQKMTRFQWGNRWHLLILDKTDFSEMFYLKMSS